MKFSEAEIETTANYFKDVYSLKSAHEGLYIEISGGRDPEEVIEEFRADPQFRLMWRLIGEEGMEEWLTDAKNTAVELIEELNLSALRCAQGQEVVTCRRELRKKQHDCVEQ